MRYSSFLYCILFIPDSLRSIARGFEKTSVKNTISSYSFEYLIRIKILIIERSSNKMKIC